MVDLPARRSLILRAETRRALPVGGDGVLDEGVGSACICAHRSLTELNAALWATFVSEGASCGVLFFPSAFCSA